jgi:cholestenol delta-isomerase
MPTDPGYYVSNFTKIAGQRNIVAELWKEYALSDSRYLTDDAGVFCLEAISVARSTTVSRQIAVLTCLRSSWGRYQC